MYDGDLDSATIVTLDRTARERHLQFDPTKNQTPAPTITQPHRTRSTADIPEPDQIAPEPLTSMIEEEVPLFLPSDDPTLPGSSVWRNHCCHQRYFGGACTVSPIFQCHTRNVTLDEEGNRGRGNTKRPSLKRKASRSLLRSPSFEPAEVADPHCLS